MLPRHKACISLKNVLILLIAMMHYTTRKNVLFVSGFVLRGGSLGRKIRSPMMKNFALSNQEMDTLIDELSVTPVFELPNKINSERIMRSVGRPQFFLRIAELCDSANGERRQQLEALADNLSATLSAVAERTESRLEDASQRLAQIISAAAEEDSGEFLVPLSDTKLKALRTSVENALTKNQLDEAVLSTVHASTKKAQEDGLDGVVAILRKLLQLYAASTLNFIIQPPNSSEQAQNNTQPNSSFHPDYQAAIDCYSELMATDADKHWDSILQRNLKGDPPKVGKNQLLAVVQAKIEQTVLLQENGSFAQRVQAEFLREIVARIETILPTTPDDLDKQDSNDLLNAFLDQTSVKSEKTST